MIGDANPVALAETKSLIQDVSRDVDVMSLSCGSTSAVPSHRGLDFANICSTDTTSEASVDSFIGQAVATFGRIDYACNVSGVLLPSVPGRSGVDFDKHFAVTARGTRICQQIELLQMAKQEPFRADDDLYPQRGSIVNILSVREVQSFDNMPSDFIRLTKADALRVAKEYIRINTICSGLIRTALLGELDEDKGEPAMEDLVSNMAVGRIGLPEEVAEAALFLTSGKASLITATTLAVDGGMQELCSK